MATMNISLPDTMRVFVEQEVSEGGYATSSEYVRGLVREKQRIRAQAAFDALILEAVQSGPGIKVTSEFWQEFEKDHFSPDANAS